jgi:methylmalonyl-CoA/ethylmalonyl-CoA epimerase
LPELPQVSGYGVDGALIAFAASLMDAKEPPRRYARVDHIALAVRELEPAVALFRDVLGFKLIRRLSTRGTHTGMLSAEMEHNGIRFVLCQGTEPESQVCRLIENYGPGVAHIALEVEDVPGTVAALSAGGLDFDTKVIAGPGLTQAFSSRCANTGMCFEFIARSNESGFLDANVQQLFDQLERADKY